MKRIVFAALLMAIAMPAVAQAIPGYVQINTAPITVTTATTTQCAAGQHCFYYVTAVNSLGESVPSNIVNATVPATSTVHTVTLTWTASFGAASYNVYQGSVPLPPVVSPATAQ
jgi:hypothetical protein